MKEKEKESDRFEVIRTLYHSGYTFTEIANRTGKTRQTISKIVNKLIPSDNTTSAAKRRQFAKCQRLFAIGYSYTDIAKETGLTRQTVSRWIHNKSFVSNSRIEQIRRIQARYKTGESLRQISISEHIPLATVSYWVDEDFFENYKEKIRIRNAISLLLDSKYEPEEIAKLLQVSKQRVEYWVKKREKQKTSEQQGNDHRDVAEPEQITNRNIDDAISLLKDGLSYEDTARILNVAKSTVWSWAKKAGFKYDKTRAKKKAYLPTIIKLYTGGASYRKISELTGVHPSTVARWIKEYI